MFVAVHFQNMAFGRLPVVHATDGTASEELPDAVESDTL